MSKKYDVVAIVGQYIDKQTGQPKPRYKNVGAVIQNSNGGFNLLLDKTFNPAGLAEPDKESIILSLFEPQNRALQAMQPQQPHTPAPPAPQQNMQAPVDDFDSDSIPF